MSRVTNFYDSMNNAHRGCNNLFQLCNSLAEAGMEGTAYKIWKHVSLIQNSIYEMDEQFGGHINDGFKSAQEGIAETLNALIKTGEK